jgi:hypothetical protein
LAANLLLQESVDVVVTNDVFVLEVVLRASDDCAPTLVESRTEKVIIERTNLIFERIIIINIKKNITI